MAKGDVITGLGESDADYYFQPAAGVEVCITSCNEDFAPAVSGDIIKVTAYAASSSMKFFVTNSLYFGSLASGAGSYNSFSGVQVK